MNKTNIISFSLYGDRPIYCIGALANLKLAPTIYPGWKCRFYVDASVPLSCRSEIESNGGELVFVNKSLGPMYGRYWRCFVACDPAVGRFVVRDVDSRLNTREKAAVDQWIESGKTFHLMRDSAYHVNLALGGMWGGLGGVFPQIHELVDGWGQYDKWGQHDSFVSEVLFPLMANDYLCHDDSGNHSDGIPFPKHPPLSGTSHVGEIVDPDWHPTDIWRRAGELSNIIRRQELSLEELRRLAEDLKYGRNELARRNEELRGAVESLNHHSHDTEHRLAQLHHELELLRQSRSFKVTAPLRKLAALFRRP
jgi:hypothetical protein